MRRIKKIASLVLAMIMVMAMAVPVFASDPANVSGDQEEFKITVKNERESISIDGQQFDAYKLFDVTYNLENKAYTYTLAAAFKDFSYTVESGETYAGDQLVTYVSGLTNDSAALNAFANAVGKYIADNKIAVSGSATAVNEVAVITLKEAGYYLVSGGATNENGGDDSQVTAAFILDTTNPNVEMQVKADAPSIDKVIVEADSNQGSEGKGTAQDVGSVVDFKLTSTVPNMTGYTSYTYTVHDTMSDGLTFNDDVAVTIGGTEYRDFTVNTNGQSFDIVFDKAKFVELAAGSAIVITYSATINENALTTDVETNTVNLEYSNDPTSDTDSTEETPEKKVYVYDFDIVIDKYAGNDENTKLENAKFVLRKKGTSEYYKWNTTDKKVEWIAVQATEGQSEEDAIKAAVTAGTIDEKATDKNGATTFTGLDSGEYELVETEAPNGYNKLTAPVGVTITITYDSEGKLLESSATMENNGQYHQDSKISNNAGSLLPSTGGIGTTIFYVVGGILVIGAGILLVTKKRMKAQ